MTYERVLVINKELLQNTCTREYKDIQPYLIVATSIDVFEFQIGTFKERPLSIQAKVIIINLRMLKFVLVSRLNHVLELKQIDDDYIIKKILVGL